MPVIVDVDVTQTEFTDIYGESGIPPGTELVLKNKSRSDPILIVISASAPEPSSTDGYEVEPRDTVLVPVNDSAVWARTTTNTTLWLNVQESPGIRPAVGPGTEPDVVSKDAEFLLDALHELSNKLSHLNAMFDEAFETSLTEEDTKRN
jgi:hypothetical protein